MSSYTYFLGSVLSVQFWIRYRGTRYHKIEKTENWELRDFTSIVGKINKNKLQSLNISLPIERSQAPFSVDCVQLHDLVKDISIQIKIILRLCKVLQVLMRCLENSYMKPFNKRHWNSHKRIICQNTDFVCSLFFLFYTIRFSDFYPLFYGCFYLIS